jgi:mannose-6-phosphate isomerase-like protein (cupin superfamily)
MSQEARKRSGLPLSRQYNQAEEEKNHMAGYLTNIEEKTRQNSYFRHVLFTGPYSQLVVMTLAPNEEIGMETHEGVDQFNRVEEGQGKTR